MRTYDVYRNGDGTITEQQIKTVVTDFKARNGKLPAALVVPKAQVAAAQAIVKAGLPVRGAGGCLVGELWLEYPENAG